MKLIYNTDSDILNIRFNDFPIVRSASNGNGTIFDFDSNDRLVAIEMVPASQMVGSPCIVEVDDFRSLFHLLDPNRPRETITCASDAIGTSTRQETEKP